MGFLNTDSMPRLVEKLSDGDNIKITGNSKGNRVGTVVKKIVEKADDVTKAIEQEVVNDSYSFKVGTGDVDVSSDVEDGFAEVGVKGVTYQNLCKVRKITHNGRGDVNISVKPNTTYTVVCDITQDSTNLVVCALFSSVFLEDYSNLNGDELYSKAVDGGKGTETKTNVANGHSIYKYTTKSNEIYCHFRGGNATTPNSITDNIMLIEGDHTNNPNLPSYFEGIVGIGDKSKNLFNSLDKTYDKQWIESNGKLILRDAVGRTAFNHFIPCKPNTNYYFSSDTTIGLKGIFEVSDLEGNNCKVLKNTDATKESFTTTSSAKFIVIKANTIVSDNITIQLEEGSTATAYEPYYDGHKIEILSHGKNLVKPTITYNNNKFDTILVSTINQCLYLNGIKEQGKSPGDSLFTNSTDYFYLKPNTKYIVSRKIFSGESNLCMLAFRLENVTTGTIQWLNTGSGEHCVINASSDIRRVSYFRIYHDPDLKIEYKNVVVGAMMEEVKEQQTTRSNYEPYVEDKTQILLDEPLMRLPNGTYDEITRDGKLIRRVGKVVLDGSEDWKTTINLDGLTYRYSLDFKFKTSDNYNNVDNIICNDLATKNFPNIYNNGEKGITTWWSNDYIKKTIAICLSNNYSLEQFKEWLSQNPITVYYELETPIITELPAPYLRIFKDGHLTFNTLVAPESTHVVQLNKSAQIERSIREVQSLDSRVGKLESFYDDMMLETNHKLSLLNYDFEYTRERNGE